MVTGTGKRLATWLEVHAHLAATYEQVALDPAGAIAFIVTFPATATAAASAVALLAAQVLDASWFKLTGVIGSLRRLSPAEILARNARTTIGSFCTHDGELAIRQTLPIAGLRTADLDETVRTLAQQILIARAHARELERGT